MAKFYKRSKNEFDGGLEASRPDGTLPGNIIKPHSDCQDVGLNEDYDLIIIGAGPSGLFCAINSVQKDSVQKDPVQKDPVQKDPVQKDPVQKGATQKSRSVLVLEKMDSPGHKLLISGSGRCNITHEGDIRDFLDHFGDHGRFLRPALLGFTNHDLITYFEAKGLAMIREKGGKIFPGTLRARDVLNILIKECEAGDVHIRCGQLVRSVAKTGNGFLVACKNCDYRSRMLVLATGGCSYPGTGSTGDGYRFARALGHSITEIAPALTPLLIKDYPFSELAGLSFSDMEISLYRQGKIRAVKGDILLTHQGLSGPAILDLSRHIRAGDVLKLSFVPGEERGALEKWLRDQARLDGACTLKTALAGRSCSVPLPPRFIRRVLEVSGIATDLCLAQLTRKTRSQLADNLTGLPLVVSELCGFNMAMVTRGGVDLKEVNPKTMESRRVNGLYLVGEVLDVDGDTGGYNLQAAFSTGMLAARSINSRLR